MAVVNNKIIDMGKKLGVNADGDLQRIFHTSTGNQAWFFASAPIDPFSKRKPFVHAQNSWPITSAGYAARLEASRLTRYGFAPAVGHLAPDAGVTWQYSRPNGTMQQPRRAGDFEGYYHKAPCPIKVEAEATRGTGSVASVKGYIFCHVSVNGAVSTLWDTDAMGIKDFFDAEQIAGTDDLWDYYYLAFRIVNKSRTSNFNPTVIVTDKTLKDLFSSTDEAYFVFPETDSDQWGFIGLIPEAHDGDTFEITAFLNSHIPHEAGHDYAVLTGNDAIAAWNSGKSLAFQAGVDRVDIPIASVFSIAGTTGYITSVTNTDEGIVTPSEQGTPMTGLQARQFLNTLNMSIDTRNSAGDWGSLPNGLGVVLVMEVEITGKLNSEALFAPDTDVTHASYVESFVRDGHQVFVWRNSLQLANKQNTTYAKAPLTPTKWIEDLNQYATTPDRMLVCHPTSGTSTVTFKISARIEKGSETVDLGTSQQYTLTY